MNKQIFLLFAALTLSIIMISCKDDEGTLTLEVNMISGDQELALDQDISVNGTIINLSIAQFYVGGVTLIDGDDQESYDKYHIFSPTDERLMLGDIDLDETFESLNFFVGVESSINSQSEMDFASRSLEDPLGPKDPQMHWNWNTGYKFVRLDGMIDTDGDGTVDDQFRHHLGTDNLLRDVELSIDRQFADGSNTVSLNFDLERLFNGIDIVTDRFTMTGDNPTPAVAAANNLPSAFSVE